MNFLKVSGHDGLVRDTSNGAIINSNISEYQRYLKQQELAKTQIDLISKHSQDINSLNKEISEIKLLLIQLLAK